MLRCKDDGRGGYYLLASPSMQCYQGDHSLLAALAATFAVLYLLWPVFIAWVLLVRLPAKGFDDAQTNLLFGFLHQRFTQKARTGRPLLATSPLCPPPAPNGRFIVCSRSLASSAGLLLGAG